MIEVKLDNLNKLANISEKYPAISEKHVNKMIRNVLTRIFSGQKENAPVGVTKGLRDRWSIDVQRFAGSLKSLVEYGGSIEKGTQPHGVSPAVLRDWARKKGLNEYAVAKSIAKKGTRANPFMKKTIESNQSAMNEEVKKTIEDITFDLKNAIM
jgi:hypothetical protein